MRNHSPANERIKREYLVYLERAKRMSPSSVDQAVAAIALFEENTGFRDFRKFHRNQAIAFQKSLAEARNAKTGKPLAKATIHFRLRAVKAFIQWLQGQPGYRSRITYDDAEYFNSSANDERVAKARREGLVPTLEQVRLTVEHMPVSTIFERRDRAVMAAAILFGSRDDALASLSVRHVNLVARTVFQDARSVRTKNAKTFLSDFFPVDPLFSEIVAAWIEELVALGFGPDDPLFPATQIAADADFRFRATGLSREFWKSANPIRRTFRKAFAAAGLPYFNPHSFRKTLAILGEKLCENAEEWKAYSQNFGHSSPMMTYNSYGPVASYRQTEILNKLSGRAHGRPREVSIEHLSVDQVRDLLSGIADRFAAQQASRKD